ncbi:unnamed protein product [Prorocentrum cordatum]|uniref:Hexosyltransferase n=1 Tax=Prorocentrum cordatum TaxID=2364126 RepID=A0ABN9VGR7_9DINO|nr:unnamed protein product [Polarella glacialis]
MLQSHLVYTRGRYFASEAGPRTLYNRSAVLLIMRFLWLSLVVLRPVRGLSAVSLSQTETEDSKLKNSCEPIGQEVEMDEPFEQRVVFPPKANCNEESWRIPKFKVSGGKHVTFSQKPWIVFRGATFRSSADAQEVALCSIRRHVVEPLKRAYALNSVHVHLCVRPHGANRRLVASAEKYFGAAIGDVSLRELSKAEQPLQQGQYRACLADVPNDARFALILRPDLVFKESLSFERAVSPDMFYFQWNLFQSCVNREIADQIHLVGGNLIPDLKDKWNSEQMGAVKPGQAYWDTFHMMFMWAANAFGQERLGYLMEYPATNCFYQGSGEIPRWHKYGFCKQRGNPGGGMHHGNLTNPLFTYDRWISADGEALCKWD